MNGASLPELVQQWKEQCQLLLGYSEELLKNFDVYGGEQSQELIERRQTIIDSFQTIDLRLRECVPEKGWTEAERRLLEEFRGFQEVATRKVLALDALVIALANERVAALKQELNQMTKRKKALGAYERNG
jgi:hypothetical protein